MFFVVGAIGDNMVETYSSIGIVTALYVGSIVVFAEYSSLNTSIVLDVLAAVLSMCLMWVSFGSIVRPIMLKCMYMSSVVDLHVGSIVVDTV